MCTYAWSTSVTFYDRSATGEETCHHHQSTKKIFCFLCTKKTCQTTTNTDRHKQNARSETPKIIVWLVVICTGTCCGTLKCVPWPPSRWHSKSTGSVAETLYTFITNASDWVAPRGDSKRNDELEGGGFAESWRAYLLRGEWRRGGA